VASAAISVAVTVSFDGLRALDDALNNDLDHMESVAAGAQVAPTNLR